MSILKSTNSGKHARLTKEGVLALGWKKDTFIVAISGKELGFGLAKEDMRIQAKYLDTRRTEHEFSCKLTLHDSTESVISIPLQTYKDLQLFEDWWHASGIVKRRLFKQLLDLA